MQLKAERLSCLLSYSVCVCECVLTHTYLSKEHNLSAVGVYTFFKYNKNKTLHFYRGLV